MVKIKLFLPQGREPMDLNPEGGSGKIHFITKELRNPAFKNQVGTFQGPRTSLENFLQVSIHLKVEEENICVHL